MIDRSQSTLHDRSKKSSARDRETDYKERCFFSPSGAHSVDVDGLFASRARCGGADSTVTVLKEFCGAWSSSDVDDSRRGFCTKERACVWSCEPSFRARRGAVGVHRGFFPWAAPVDGVMLFS
jgi:hypothetical protein